MYHNYNFNDKIIIELVNNPCNCNRILALGLSRLSLYDTAVYCILMLAHAETVLLMFMLLYEANS